MVEMKGLAFRSWMAAFKTLYGPSAYDALLTFLMPETRELLERNLLLVGGWYSTTLYNDLLQAGTRAGPAGKRVAFDVSYRATTTDMAGVNGFLLGLVGKKLIVKNFHRIVGLYTRGGSARYEPEDTTHGRMILENPDATRLFWQDLLGGCQAIFDSAFAVDAVRIRLESGGGENDGRAVYYLSFGANTGE